MNTPAMQAVAEALAEHPNGMTAEQIMAATRLRPTVLYGTLMRMEAMGTLRLVGEQPLPTKGRSYLLATA